MASLAQQGDELMAFFANKTGRRFNRAKAKWDARQLVQSYGLDDCKEAVLWYVKVSQNRDWRQFVFNCGDYISEARSVERDAERRRMNRRIANQWRNS